MATYWDGSYPPSVLHPTIPPTGATAGTPGAWTPAGADPPNTLVAANALGYSGAAWTIGQYIELEDGTDVYWDGAAFVAGRAPAEDPEPESAPAKRSRKSTAKDE